MPALCSPVGRITFPDSLPNSPLTSLTPSDDGFDDDTIVLTSQQPNPTITKLSSQNQQANGHAVKQRTGLLTPSPSPPPFQLQATPVKRRCGRPRKHPVKVVPTDAFGDPIKRGRGHPRKNPLQPFDSGVHKCRRSASTATPAPAPSLAPEPTGIDIWNVSILNACSFTSVRRIAYIDQFYWQIVNDRYNQDYSLAVQRLWMDEEATVGEIEEELLRIGFRSLTRPEEILLFLRHSTVFWMDPVTRVLPQWYNALDGRKVW